MGTAYQVNAVEMDRCPDGGPGGARASFSVIMQTDSR